MCICSTSLRCSAGGGAEPSRDYLLPDLFVSPDISWEIGEGGGGLDFQKSALPRCGRDFVLPGQDWSCQEGGQEKGQEEHCRAHGLELPAALPDGCPAERTGWESCSQPSPGATGWFFLPPAPPCFPQDVPREVAGLGWRCPRSFWGLFTPSPSPSRGWMGVTEPAVLGVLEEQRMLWGGGSQGNAPSPPCPPHCPARSPRAFLCPPALSPGAITPLHVVRPQ